MHVFFIFFVRCPCSLLTFIECSAFSGRSRRSVMPVFSIMSSFFIYSYSTSLLFILSICLPWVLVPSVLPSKTVRRGDSLLHTWHNQFICLWHYATINSSLMIIIMMMRKWTRGQSNLTKSTSRGAHSPVRGHPRRSKVVPLNSWGRVSY